MQEECEQQLWNIMKHISAEKNSQHIKSVWNFIQSWSDYLFLTLISFPLGITKEGRRIMWNPMEATWTEKYFATLNRLWMKLPEWLASTLITLIVFVFGVSIKGDWIIVAVHLMKQIGYYCNIETLPETLYGNCSEWSNVSLETFYLKNLSAFWIYSSAVAYGFYFVLGGFLHWYFYIRQRDRPEEWKCQPYKWLPPELELHEIILGSISLMCANTFSSLIACYISNGGWSMMYYGLLDYGWFWLLFQAAFVFIYQDYITYWLHRCYHMPFLYKHFHKLHHKYKQPTAFSVTAIHPVEIVSIQLVLCLPLFFCPLHWLPFYAVAFYTYYHGIMDHSGIDFKAPWWQPWRPDTMFHDNHHQYFHVNFSFNIYYWDILHGTHRQPDRIYREHIFYGKGKALKDACKNEILEEIHERLGENPNAHRSNVNYLLSEEACNETITHR